MSAAAAAAAAAAAGSEQEVPSIMLRRQPAMEGSPLALAALGAAFGVGLSLFLVALYVTGRAARRAWRRRQRRQQAHKSHEGEAGKDRMFEGTFSQEDVDSDDL